MGHSVLRLQSVCREIQEVFTNRIVCREAVFMETAERRGVSTLYSNTLC